VFDNVPSAIIELKENGVEIEGHYVEFPCEAGEFEKVLGQPNRILSKANNIMVWDDLGVFIYERPHSGLIVQFSVAHGPRDFDFYPQTLYAGSVVFDSSVITSETGSSYLKQQGFEESWAWQMPFGAGTIYIDIDEDTDTVSETSFTISASQ
jgi:hypothetical protein